MKKLIDVRWIAEYTTAIEVDIPDDIIDEAGIADLVAEECVNINPLFDNSNCYVHDTFEIRWWEDITDSYKGEQ